MDPYGRDTFTLAEFHGRSEKPWGMGIDSQEIAKEPRLGGIFNRRAKPLGGQLAGVFACQGPNSH